MIILKNIFSKTAELSNGVLIPMLGFGLWQIQDGKETENTVKDALELGYRLIDTAEGYANEAGVGTAVHESDIAREELFITTKVNDPSQGYDNTLRAFEASARRLRTDYVDLYLIHWPMRSTYVETWRAFVRLYEEKRVRSIGVSNFKIRHIEAIVQDSGVWPMVNQIERHPQQTQKEMLAYGKDNGIIIEAWSPLMQGNLQNPVLSEIAQKYGKTPAQIVLRWHLQDRVVIIPKSIHKNRLLENSQLDAFKLDEEDMQRINALNEDRYILVDPDNFPWDA